MMSAQTEIGSVSCGNTVDGWERRLTPVRGGNVPLQLPGDRETGGFNQKGRSDLHGGVLAWNGATVTQSEAEGGIIYGQTVVTACNEQ